MAHLLELSAVPRILHDAFSLPILDELLHVLAILVLLALDVDDSIGARCGPLGWHIGLVDTPLELDDHTSEHTEWLDANLAPLDDHSRDVELEVVEFVGHQTLDALGL